jgi:hypothetical protein
MFGLPSVAGLLAANADPAVIVSAIKTTNTTNDNFLDRFISFSFDIINSE